MSKLHSFTRLMTYCVPHKRACLVGFILLLCATLTNVSGPYLVKIFIDEYLRPGNATTQIVVLFSAIYMALQVVSCFAFYRQSLIFNNMALRIVQHIREQAFNKVLSMPMSYFDHTPTGSLVSRITNDTESVKDLYVNVLSIFVQNIILLLAILAAMFMLNWKLGLVAGTFLVLVLLVMLLYQKISAPVFFAVRGLVSDLNSNLNESIQGMPLIQHYNQQSRFISRFDRIIDSHYSEKMKNVRLNGMLLRALIDCLHILTLCVLLVVFGLEGIQGVVEIGTIYAFINYLGHLVEPLMDMTTRLVFFQKAMASSGKIFDILDAPSHVVEHSKMSNPVRSGDLKLEQICFSYQPGKKILDNINLTVPHGKFLAIIGPTGAGKSTLVNLLMRMYEPTSGRITLDGIDLHQFSSQDLRSHIGMVQQDPTIFTGSILDNLCMGQSYSREVLWQALSDAGLKEFVEHLPDGLYTLLGERGNNISAGQRQLLALARVLIRKPKVLILDEATSSIDSHHESKIQEMLRKLHGKVTLLAIAHRLSTITSADNIIVLEDGKISQQGKHTELVLQDGFYKHYLDYQKIMAQMN